MRERMNEGLFSGESCSSSECRRTSPHQFKALRPTYLPNSTLSLSPPPHNGESQNQIEKQTKHLSWPNHPRKRKLHGESSITPSRKLAWISITKNADREWRREMGPWVSIFHVCGNLERLECSDLFRRVQELLKWIGSRQGTSCAESADLRFSVEGGGPKRKVGFWRQIQDWPRFLFEFWNWTHNFYLSFEKQNRSHGGNCPHKDICRSALAMCSQFWAYQSVLQCEYMTC